MRGVRTGRASRLFQPARFTEAARRLPNPGQGWYQICTYDLGAPFDPAGTFLERDAMALVRVDIGCCRNEALGPGRLDNLRAILRFFDESGVDVILRIAYDFEGRGLEREPELFSRVREHMEELAPVLREFEDRIVIFQGLLVGSWGEMHQSRFLSAGRLRELEAAFRSGGNRRTWLAVRRPAFLRMLAGPGEFPDGLFTRRLCLFNDALGGSETDMGTYGWKARASASWEEPWVRADELEFMKKACAFAPFGGETVPPEDGRTPSWRETAALLGGLGLSYLNRQHDARALERWRETPCRMWRGGPWAGASLYDYIGGHMGFRFLIRQASVRPSEGGGGPVLSVEIENTGFGNLLQEARAELLLRGGDGTLTRREPDWDARSWLRGSRTVCRTRVPPGAGALYLSLRRKWDGRAILFANQTEESGREGPMVLLGTMLHTGEEPE
ncbi:DUF4832 domain-containing protein [uncultured Oscillibacter sp.]|uniref:DUF4832 domain-containing protein n=1 Tax=uncultured Oscillibacter sp. TaxID=876091 RepID=UPI002603BC9C|nr:DUF4832 domain-containing protein [uncultured Oscillibacter sp.]